MHQVQNSIALNEAAKCCEMDWHHCYNEVFGIVCLKSLVITTWLHIEGLQIGGLLQHNSTMPCVKPAANSCCWPQCYGLPGKHVHMRYVMLHPQLLPRSRLEQLASVIARICKLSTSLTGLRMLNMLVIILSQIWHIRHANLQWFQQQNT